MPFAGPRVERADVGKYRRLRQGLRLVPILGVGLSWFRSRCFATASAPSAQGRDLQSLPTVSVQVITYNRPALLLEALCQIEAQDYPRALEVLILDDSSTSSETDIRRFADSSRHDIQYRFLSQRLSIGEKRNLAASSTSADFICTWDDDDIYTLDRVRLQAEFLSRNPRCNCATIERRFFYWLEEGTLRGCRDMQFLPLENTLCFRRRWFEAGRRFDNGSLNEGLGLLRGARGVKHPGRLGILPMSAEELPFLYVKHSGSMTGGEDVHAEAGASPGTEPSLLPLVRAFCLQRFPQLPSCRYHSRILGDVGDLLRELVARDVKNIREEEDAMQAASYLEALTGQRSECTSLQGLIDGIEDFQAALVTGQCPQQPAEEKENA